MKEDIYYFNKFPKTSEFNVGHYLSLLLIFVSIIIIYLIKYYPDVKSLLLLIVILAYIFLGSRARLMKSLLIKKIEITIKENYELSEKNPSLGTYLLTVGSLNRGYFRNEIAYFLNGIIVFLILYGIASFFSFKEILFKYYLIYIYLCIWMTIFTFKRLEDVFNYFQKIKEIFVNIISKDKDQVILQRKPINHTYYFQINKWRNIKKVSILASFVFIIVSSLFFASKPFYILLIVSTGGIIFLGTNIIYLNRQVNNFLPFLRDYDESVKEKLGIIYKPKITDKGYGELADELNKDIKDIFR